MIENGVENAVRTWSAAECPYTIEYSTRVLDDIRVAVVDAFFSVPRGGVEIGGILLGSSSGGKISIQDYRALDCEHAMGPSFTLSARDQAQLAGLVAAVAGNGNGLRVVGWYHSHTRSDLFLSQADQDIHQRFFPEPWQVALVLKPHTFEPPRCGFFFPETDGAIRGAASYQEFVLEPLLRRPARSGDARPLPPALRPLRPESKPAGPVLTAAAEAGPEPVPPITREMEPPLVAAEKDASFPESPLDSSRLAIEERARVQSSPQATTEQPDAVPPPATDDHQRKHSVLKTAGWLIFALLVLALGISISIPSIRERGSRIWSAIWHPPTPAAPSSRIPLGLQAERQGGDLKLTWNRQSAAVLSATSGVLSIEDGNAGRKIQLDPGQLRTGSIFYAPTSGQIQMQLTVSAPQETTSESVLVILPETGARQVQILPRTEIPAATIADAKLPNAAQPRRPSKPFTLPAEPRHSETAGSLVPVNEPPDLSVKTDPAALIPLGLGRPVVPPPQPAPAQPLVGLWRWKTYFPSSACCEVVSFEVRITSNGTQLHGHLVASFRVRPDMVRVASFRPPPSLHPQLDFEGKAEMGGVMRFPFKSNGYSGDVALVPAGEQLMVLVRIAGDEVFSEGLDRVRE